MTLAWLLPVVVLTLRAGLVMAQSVEGANLGENGINIHARGVFDEHLTNPVSTNSHSVQLGYSGWTRRGGGGRGVENHGFEKSGTKNRIREQKRRNEYDYDSEDDDDDDDVDAIRIFMGERVVFTKGTNESNGNVDRGKVASSSNIVRRQVEQTPSISPPSPTPPQSSSSADADTIPQKYTKTLLRKAIIGNDSTGEPVSTTPLTCIDKCIAQPCTAANPYCMIVDGTANCFPATSGGWRLSSCPESLTYIGPISKENESCVLLSTPNDPATLNAIVTVMLKTINTRVNATDGYTTELLKDYGNCDTSHYCDSNSTPSICKFKLVNEKKCESSNQCQSGRCLEEQGRESGGGSKECLGVNEKTDDEGTDQVPSGSSVNPQNARIKLILTAIIPLSVGLLLMTFVLIYIIHLRRKEMDNRRKQVSYPKSISSPPQYDDEDNPHVTWTNITRPFTAIRESIIRSSRFSRMTDTDTREQLASVLDRRDSTRRSILLPPPPKLTNSLMWMQERHPLKPVYERIHVLRSSPPQHAEDLGTGTGQSSSGLIYPSASAPSSAYRTYHGYI